MSATVNHIIDPWLPRPLPRQLAALGELYRDALEAGVAESPTSVGWRLYAALAFATRLASLPRLAELTGLTVDQLSAVLVEFAGDDDPLVVAA